MEPNLVISEVRDMATYGGTWFLRQDLLLAFVESSFLLVISSMMQTHIFWGRRKDNTISNRRYENSIVGLNLLFLLLGVHVAAVPKLQHVLDESFGPTWGVKIAFIVLLSLLTGIGYVVRLVADPHRAIFPTDSGNAQRVRDGINLCGYAGLAIYLSVFMGLL